MDGYPNNKLSTECVFDVLLTQFFVAGLSNAQQDHT